MAFTHNTLPFEISMQQKQITPANQLKCVACVTLFVCVFEHFCVRVCFTLIGHRDYSAITAHLDRHLCVNPELTRDQRGGG